MKIENSVIRYHNEENFLKLHGKPIIRKESDQRIVVLDIEITGFIPKRGHRIIKIGAVALKNNEISSKFHNFILIQRCTSGIIELNLQI